MQETCERIIPKIVCTKPNFTESCGTSHHDEENLCERRLVARQRRLGRSRVRRNSRRSSLNQERESSSSRSPSPSPGIHDRQTRLTSEARVSHSARLLKRDTINAGRFEGHKRVDNINSHIGNTTSGYGQYLQLLQVPQANLFVSSSQLEWGEPSGDDLSSEWESDHSDSRNATNDKIIDNKNSGWRKLRNIVQWAPFVQTYKKQRYPWVQLAGHQGNFKAGPSPGTILKKLCPQEEACFRLLMRDILRPYVPEFKGVLGVRETAQTRSTNPDTEALESKISTEDTTKTTVVASYLQLEDLLSGFEQPCVMDCKVGVRTYLESELAKAKERPKLRKDMYEKMIQVDPSAPSSEERNVQGVTKPRYMVWRETISSTATLGFRVEGIKFGIASSSKDFKTTKSREQVKETLKCFVEKYPHAVPLYLQRLKSLRATLKTSQFFATHEVIGSSLLFVHDRKNANIWMIDFAKTLPLPSHLPSIKHDVEWQVGNHEDGYLIGVNNLIDIFQDLRDSQT